MATLNQADLNNDSIKQNVRTGFACRQMATSAAEERLGRCSALAARYVAGINQAGWMEREVRTLLAAQKPEGVRGCLVRQALHH
jgi:hypothetical protein